MPPQQRISLLPMEWVGGNKNWMKRGSVNFLEIEKKFPPLLTLNCSEDDGNNESAFCDNYESKQPQSECTESKTKRGNWKSDKSNGNHNETWEMVLCKKENVSSMVWEYLDSRETLHGLLAMFNVAQIV